MLSLPDLCTIGCTHKLLSTTGQLVNWLASRGRALPYTQYASSASRTCFASASFSEKIATVWTPIRRLQQRKQGSSDA